MFYFFQRLLWSYTEINLFNVVTAKTIPNTVFTGFSLIVYTGCCNCKEVFIRKVYLCNVKTLFG
jgi:hypothetical protein